jgi:hypothetical protein
MQNLLHKLSLLNKLSYVNKLMNKCIFIAARRKWTIQYSTYSIINDNDQIINAMNINTISTNLNRPASFLLERLTSDHKDMSSNPRRDRTWQTN